MRAASNRVPGNDNSINFPSKQNQRRNRAREPAQPRKVSVNGPTEKGFRVVRRPDGLVVGSAMAKLLDAALEGPKTHQEYCDLVGWGQCLSLLKSALAKSGHKLVTTKVEGEKIRYSAK